MLIIMIVIVGMKMAMMTITMMHVMKAYTMPLLLFARVACNFMLVCAWVRACGCVCVCECGCVRACMCVRVGFAEAALDFILSLALCFQYPLLVPWIAVPHSQQCQKISQRTCACTAHALYPSVLCCIQRWPTGQ